MTSERRPSRVRGRAPAVMAVALVTATLWWAATPAGAIPPGGADPDTPGTTATVSPARLVAGEVISFTITGFPAGETVYVKIDDGLNCSAAAVHGACVHHQQAIPSSGRVAGRFTLPSDLAPGPHWLRFLASQPILDRSGNQIGVNGFTLRGASDFTIVSAPAATVPGGSATDGASGTQGGAGSSGAGSAGAGASGAGSGGAAAVGSPGGGSGAASSPVTAAPSGGATGGTATTTVPAAVAGVTTSIVDPAVAPVEGEDLGVVDGDETVAPTTRVPASGETTQRASTARNSRPTSDGSSAPVVGIVLLVVAVGAAAAVVVGTRRKRA